MKSELRPAGFRGGNGPFDLLRIGVPYKCGTEDLPEVQAAIPRQQGVVSTLPRALHLEPGKLCKPRLPAPHGIADPIDDLFLALPVFGSCRAIGLALPPRKLRQP